MIDKNNKFKTELTYESLNSEKDKYEFVKKLSAQIEWMKRQLEYSMYSINHKVKYNLHKGEIFEIDWGINVNAEFSNRHYGVVLADSNEYNPLVLVCPLKSNHTGGHPRSDIDLGIVPGLKEGTTTLAIINQIKTIDKMRLYSRQIINNKGDGEDTIRLPLDKVNLIIKAYHLLIDNKPFWIVE